jgi:hypothetical protein
MLMEKRDLPIVDMDFINEMFRLILAYATIVNEINQQNFSLKGAY